VKQSKYLIPQNSVWKYNNLNPSAPTIKGLIKLHKTDLHVRLVVNWRNVPAYTLSRSLTQKTKELTPLPYSLNVRNSTQLIQELKQTPIKPTHTFASLDTSNMYTNIPLTDTRHILNESLQNNVVDTEITKELLTWFDTITKQNFFSFRKHIHIQTDGLAMGAPLSSTLSEVVIQHIEHTHIPLLAAKHKLVNHFRFVDDSS
jgi:hypothetical protein